MEEATITVTKLSTMPFTRLMPRSAPIWNCMNESAANPNNVVTALAAMVPIDLRMARAIACSASAHSSLVGEGVQEEDGVIERDGELQDGAHRIRDERDLAEKYVRPHVDEDGNADGGDEQHGLDPRHGGHDEQEHDDGHDDGDGHEHLLDHALLHLCVVRRIARHRVSGPRESM